MIIAIILDNEYNSLKYVDIFENINNNIWTILRSLHRDDFHIRGNFGRYHQSRYQRFKVWFSGDYNVILNLKRCLLLIFITVFTSFQKEISIQIHIAYTPCILLINIGFPLKGEGENYYFCPVEINPVHAAEFMKFYLWHLYIYKTLY